MLRKFLAILAFSTALSVATPAQALPVIGALAAFAATPIGGFLIQAAIGVGASLLALMLKPKPPVAAQEEQRPPGVQLDLEIGGDRPVAFPVGWTAIGGHRIYAGAWGASDKTPNAYYVDVILLSDMPTPANPVLWVNEQRCTINWGAAPTDQGYPVTEFNSGGADHMWVRFLSGSQIAADPYLLAKFGSHATKPFTSDMIGRGQAIAIVTCLTNRTLFIHGAPSFVFESTGIPLYNIAKDTTAGGSGAHRWADQTTWEPSSNPVVIAYNIRRGIFYNGEWVYGGNNKKALSAARLPASNWIAGINACDLAIALAAGGTEPQFRAGGVITGDMEPAAVIEALLQSANARMAETGGIYKVQVGAPGAAVYSFTDENIVVTEGQSFDPFPPLEGTHNAIEATYPEPDEKWGTKDAPGRYNSTWEAEDSGRRLVADVAFTMAPYKYQVQRLMQALIKDARRFRNHVITLPPDAWVLEPNDVVAWTSTRNGYSNKKFVVTSIIGRRNYNQVVALKEVDPADYDWVPATDQLPVSIGTLVIERPPAQLITGWQVLPATFYDTAGGGRRPTIEVRYDGGQGDVKSVRVMVRLKSSSDVVFDAEIPYAAPFAVKLNGVFLPNTMYQAQGDYIPYSGRAHTPSAWLDVTTPDVRTSFADIDDAVNNFQEWIGVNLRDLLDDAQLRSALNSDLDFARYEDKQTLRTELRLGDARVTAGYTQAVLLATGPDSALADSITQLDASVDEVSASGTFRMTASVAPSGYSARIGAEAKGGTPGDWRSAAWYLDVNSTPGVPTRFVVVADQTAILDSVGTVLALFENDGSVAYARIPALNSDKINAGQIIASHIAAGQIIASHIAAGQVTADKISVASLEAISATLGNVVVNGSLVVNGTLSTPKYAGQSIIVAGFTFNATDFGLSDSSPATFGSVTITTNGGQVVVIANAGARNNAGAGADYNFRLVIYKNGVAQIDEAVATVLGGSKHGSGTLIWVDTSPGVASNTYSIAGYGSSQLTHIFSGIVAENHKNA